MAEYQPLSPDEIEETTRRYFATRESKTERQAQPTIVLVGGQPGAGKSAASRIARAEFKEAGGFVHVDADRMRARIDGKGSTPTSEQTQGDAGKLATRLRTLAIEGRRNIIEEGTFKDPEGIENFIANMQRAGYKVDLVAVATAREESVLGIYQRYEAQHAQGTANPRFVSEAYHDLAMDGFARTVARNEANFDRVRVVDRAGTTHFDSQVNTAGTAIEALTKAQRITDARLIEVAAAWEAVQQHAASRGATATYLADVDRNAQDVIDTQKGRIHLHALDRLEPNFKAVAGDDRFSQHTNAELTKVAYYRGFHEKAFEFKSLSTDFVAYDAAMADREKAQKLPDVAELELRQLERARPRVHSRDDGYSL